MALVRNSTIVSPVRTAAFKAVLWSLGLHLGTIAALLAIETWLMSWTSPPQFGGRRVVIQVASTPTAESAAEALSRTFEIDADAAPHDVLLPRVAEIAPHDVLPREQQTVVKVIVDLDVEAERLQRSDESRRTAPAPSSTSRREAVPELASLADANPLSRQQLAHRPTTSLASAAAPQMVGTDAETPPDFSGNRKPEYPAQAYLAGIEGRVVLRIQITATGNVERVEVARSSGHAILDRAAVTAVRTWRGTPARRGDRPVASTQLLPVRFQL
jgi:protein TonB